MDDENFQLKLRKRLDHFSDHITIVPDLHGIVAL